jgi:mannose-6-phosphate isomerase-like protein (cupin superfamily)
MPDSGDESLGDGSRRVRSHLEDRSAKPNPPDAVVHDQDRPSCGVLPLVGTAAAGSFRVSHLFAERLHRQVAHDGEGEIEAARIVTDADLAGGCNFIDYVELPPGTSIGDHEHAFEEEELYLVLSGNGVMRLGDDQFPVGPGDLVRNPPGGWHGLTNPGPATLRLFVFELSVPGGRN